MSKKVFRGGEAIQKTNKFSNQRNNKKIQNKNQKKKQKKQKDDTTSKNLPLVSGSSSDSDFSDMIMGVGYKVRKTSPTSNSNEYKNNNVSDMRDSIDQIENYNKSRAKDIFGKLEKDHRIFSLKTKENKFDYNSKARKGGSQLPTGFINNTIPRNEVDSIISGKPIDNFKLDNGAFGMNTIYSDSLIENEIIPSLSKKDKKNMYEKDKKYSIGNAVIDHSVDLNKMMDHLENLKHEMMNNPLYKFAIGVAVARGSRRTDIYIGNHSKFFLSEITKYHSKISKMIHGPSSMSSGQIKEYSEILRSVAYSLKSNGIQKMGDTDNTNDLFEGIEKTFFSIKENVGNPSSSSTQGDVINSQSIYSGLLNSAIKDLNKLINYNARLKDIFFESDVMSQRKFYIKEDLISATDQAMTELKNRSPKSWSNAFRSIRGKPAIINATRLIFTSESLSCNLQKLVASVMHSFDLKANVRATLQIITKMVGDSISDTCKQILMEINELGLHSFDDPLLLDRSTEEQSDTFFSSSGSHTKKRKRKQMSSRRRNIIK